MSRSWRGFKAVILACDFLLPTLSPFCGRKTKSDLLVSFLFFRLHVLHSTVDGRLLMFTMIPASCDRDSCTQLANKLIYWTMVMEGTVARGKKYIDMGKHLLSLWWEGRPDLCWCHLKPSHLHTSESLCYLSPTPSFYPTLVSPPCSS
jgi:hypothetical protein